MDGGATREASDASATALVAASGRAWHTLLARGVAPGLHLVATPIGNLGDLSLRALATLASVDRIYCEDTRHSRHLLDHFGIQRPLVPFHEHNETAAQPRILEELATGGRVALISDAGTPLISDPGYKLVRACLAAGHTVTAVPGASAVLAALAISGLPTDRFHFAGFLPPKATARRSRLETLAALDATVVVFEAPGRLTDTLQDLATLLPTRELAVARELTKLHETVWRGCATDILAAIGDGPVKGECVLLIAPAAVASAAIDDSVIRDDLARLLLTEPLGAAVRRVAADLQVPRNRVYALALELKHKGSPA